MKVFFSSRPSWNTAHEYILRSLCLINTHPCEPKIKGTCWACTVFTHALMVSLKAQKTQSWGCHWLKWNYYSLISPLSQIVPHCFIMMHLILSICTVQQRMKMQTERRAEGLCSLNTDQTFLLSMENCECK